jgi:hypothetical protein
MQIATTHHLSGQMIAEMPVKDTVGYRHLLCDVSQRLLHLRLDA